MTAFFGAPFFAVVLRTTRTVRTVTVMTPSTSVVGHARRPPGRATTSRSTLEPGGWLGLIGPNGAGKTTLLRAVAGPRPVLGLAPVSDEEVAAQPRRDLARRVAVVPQSPVIPPEMTVLEYACSGGRRTSATRGARGTATSRSLAALERLDVGALADRRLGSLSGGERQRAVLARALAQERASCCSTSRRARSTSARSSRFSSSSRRSARERGLTVLSAMHDLTLAAQYADRLVLVDGGREVARGAPGDVLTEELVARHYGASVRIVADGEGRIAVVPLRSRARAPRSGSERA